MAGYDIVLRQPAAPVRRGAGSTQPKASSAEPGGLSWRRGLAAGPGGDAIAPDAGRPASGPAASSGAVPGASPVPRPAHGAAQPDGSGGVQAGFPRLGGRQNRRNAPLTGTGTRHALSRTAWPGRGN